MAAVDAESYYPAPQIMSAAERRAQVAARNGVCNGTVVVASCWGFDPTDSTEFLQVCAPPLIVVLLRAAPWAKTGLDDISLLLRTW